MPTSDPSSNRAYCRAYYERLKQDPEKLRIRQQRKAEAQRARRSRQQGKTCDLTVTSTPRPVTSTLKPVTSPVTSRAKPVTSSVNPPVTSPTGGKHSASKTQGDVAIPADEIVQAWHRSFDEQAADEDVLAKLFELLE